MAYKDEPSMGTFTIGNKVYDLKLVTWNENEPTKLYKETFHMIDIDTDEVVEMEFVPTNKLMKERRV